MSELLSIKKSTLEDIGNQVRAKTGKSDLISVMSLANEIKSIEINAQPILQEKTVTENGEYTADEGYDGLSKVIVDVEQNSSFPYKATASGQILEVQKANAATVVDASVFAFAYSSSAIGTITE